MLPSRSVTLLLHLCPLSKGDRRLAQLTFACVLFVLVELRRRLIIDPLTCDHWHVNSTAVIALMVLLTYHLDGHIWCKALEKMLVVSWHSWVVHVLNHAVVLVWQLLTLVSWVVYLAVHLLALLWIDELTLIDSGSLRSVSVFSVGAEARLLLETTMRAVITLVMSWDDVLGVQALVTLVAVNITVKWVAVVVGWGRCLTICMFY